jgi:hypothetical protein
MPARPTFVVAKSDDQPKGSGDGHKDDGPGKHGDQPPMAPGSGSRQSVEHADACLGIQLALAVGVLEDVPELVVIHCQPSIASCLRRRADARMVLDLTAAGAPSGTH